MNYLFIPIYLGDYSLDQIYPNSNACPVLDNVEDAAFASAGWLTENTSTKVVQITNKLNSIFGAGILMTIYVLIAYLYIKFCDIIGMWTWYNVLDCLMCTTCTNRPIPDGSGDAVMTDDLFYATVAQATFQLSYLYTYNNYQYSKLSMGNTAWHVHQNLNHSDTLKLAVFSGHDTTGNGTYYMQLDVV